MNKTTKTGLAAGLLLAVLASLMPTATGANISAVIDPVCPITEGDGVQSGTVHDHDYRYCVVDNTKTGGTGVLCSTDEWSRGSYGKTMPAAYQGEQDCALGYQDNSLCFGYHWYYYNNGGYEEDGDRDSYQCNGLP